MIQRTHSLALAGALEMGGAFFITCLVSKISYQQFEVRFLRYKKNFEYELRALRS